MMRIVVANLTSGGLSGGYRKYLRRLMPLLASDRRVTVLTVLVPAGSLVELDPAIDVLTVDRSAAGLGEFARLTTRLRPDVVFVPTARTAAFGTTPVVTMVRNMEPLEAPFGGNAWREGLRNLARAWEARRACRAARRVIAVSNHVRQVIVSRWGLDQGRVATVYHGVDTPDVERTEPRADARTLFTAGSIRPARGLEDVLRALPLVGPDVGLVIAGTVDPGCEAYAARLRALCDRTGVADRVTWVGGLSETDMVRTFRRSAAFVMTSRAEACPNTALEAMSCGVPSVSVDRPPMPEFFADAALYYPTGDAPALAHQIRSLFMSPTRMDDLARAAAGRAGAFTWTGTRDRTLDELEQALS
jgi:glycosyltransferase involved in cell wall biosynthesis